MINHGFMSVRNIIITLRDLISADLLLIRQSSAAISVSNGDKHCCIIILQLNVIHCPTTVIFTGLIKQSVIYSS